MRKEIYKLSRMDTVLNVRDKAIVRNSKVVIVLSSISAFTVYSYSNIYIHDNQIFLDKEMWYLSFYTFLSLSLVFPF